MTLRAFIGSIWFKGLYKTAVTVGALMITLAVPVWWFIAGDAKSQVRSVAADLAQVKVDRAARITLTDNRLTAIDAKIADLGVDLGEVKKDTGQTKVDVATMKGILQELQRRNLARYASPVDDLPPLVFASLVRDLSPHGQ